MNIDIPIIISFLTFISLLLVFKDRIFGSGVKSQVVEDKVKSLEESDKRINKCITEVNKDIKDLKENHLTHIQSDIGDIKINLGRINTTLEFLRKK